jgi:indole-3-glycerol phosphate synthase
VGVLEQILEVKARDIECLKQKELPLPPVRRPLALRRAPGDPLRLVAEIKRRSPSAGALSTRLDVRERAAAYQRAGADMVSVLCDAHFFDGGFEHLEQARSGCSLPLLCKEFVLDEAQVAAARAHGGDAVLIIVRCVSKDRLAALVQATRAFQLEPFVEVTTEAEARSALDAGAEIIGVNARDLDTLEIDTTRAARVLAYLPPSSIRVYLSGLATPEQVASVAASDVDAALIGEALMRIDDPVPLLSAMRRAAG